MSPAHRVNIGLPEDTYAELAQRSAADGILPGQLAHRLVALGLYGVPHQAGLPTQPGTAPWLEPWDAPAPERAAWRAEFWQATVSLARRYPTHLANLEADFYRLAHRAETLGALIAWRAELDAGEHIDPRHELAFQQALEQLAQLLKQQNPGADVSRTAFDPDAAAPPRYAGQPDVPEPLENPRKNP